MKDTTRMRMFLTGTATCWASISLAVASAFDWVSVSHSSGWVAGGAVITAVLWVLTILPNMDCDIQADLG